MVYYLLVTAIPILSCALIYAMYKIISFQNMQNRRIELLLKTSYTCVSRLKPVTEKIDGLQQDSMAALENQKKSYQHLRVLLASLNTQIKQLDKHLAPSSFEDADQFITSEMEAKLQNVNNSGSSGDTIGRLLKRSHNVVPERQMGTVKLEEVLRARRTLRNENRMENASDARRVING